MRTAGLILLFLAYLVYTIRYTIVYVKLDSHLTPRQKILNGILIWAIPFAWIRVLKVILKPKEYVFPKEFKERGTTMDEHSIYHP